MTTLRYRPCDHCGHRHLFASPDDDTDECPMCGNEMYPSTYGVDQNGANALLHYVQHKPRCAALEVMWHKGPCDCGLSLLLKNTPDWVKDFLGPAAVICTTCGDKKKLEQHDGTIECPNCKD